MSRKRKTENDDDRAPSLKKPKVNIAQPTLDRLSKELKDWKPLKELSEHFQVETINNNMLHWKGFITITNSCPFINGKYSVDIQFPHNYPFHPPNIKFINKMYHPNISENGLIDLDMLGHQWSPAYTIIKVLLTLSCVINEPIRINKQWEHINNECVKLYNENRILYESTANEYAMQYANATKYYTLKDTYVAIKYCLETGFGQHLSLIFEPIIIQYIGFNIKKLHKWCKDFKLDHQQKYKQLLYTHNETQPICKKQLLNLQCRTLTQKILNISIWNESVVKDLKQEISNKEGTPLEQFRLVLHGSKMHDHKMLNHYKLTNAIVHVILRYE